MDWQQRASLLADRIAPPGSPWRQAVLATPRHRFVPNWWGPTAEGWELHAGAGAPKSWLEHAYADRSVVTRVGSVHADHADAAERPDGAATSSATLPSLVVRMYDLALIGSGMDVLDVATGSGYGAALLATRFGSRQVTTIDVDPYLVEAAARRLADAGLHPEAVVCDATRRLPGRYDRIVSMVGMPTIPESWVSALRTGGRLVTTLAGTTMLITATKHDDGRLYGRVEWERAGFMAARSGPDYPPVAAAFEAALSRPGEDIGAGRYPVLNVKEAWDVYSMLEVECPGIVHRYREDDGVRTALMVHADGSWARARAPGSETAEVHQGGPRRLWDLLDGVRDYWVEHGELPLRGARVIVPATGGLRLLRGAWRARIPADG
ncbi:methyltransferase domain-containing protein [Nocardiopsis ansamitocini]|uniref:Protein-L-isoaspartate O-methyltransferase n=1 Tax=Nocardiopsis ansamitocini TaxID=1670832 RepID=A0A9W6PBB5_9ACTN|nr:methyltransferase domain-containing protein [Nocardiopsis ansamitocini]GLU50535.1 protein-L-isoaspartate O-methyltransferase [Nocardiopsis ansamitocini]